MQEEALRTSCRIPDKGEVAASRGDYAFILTLYLCVQVGNCSNYIAPGMCITDTSYCVSPLTNGLGRKIMIATK